jgi:predicted ArsR family transcriptional regulator
MENPLAILLGRTASKLLLYLIHYGEAYATGAAKDLGVNQSAVQRQLEKLEGAGFLVSKLVGRTRLYTINPKNPTARKLRELGAVFYEAMTMKEREKLFPTRRRPRRPGKPTLER